MHLPCEIFYLENNLGELELEAINTTEVLHMLHYYV